MFNFPEKFPKPNIPRIKEWVQLTGVTGITQVVIQAIGLISGIIIIRLLPTKEYALYTLANTMLGMMVVLADSGIGAGVMSEGGKVWKNKDELGTVLVTGLDLRKKFAIGSLIIAIPILLYLLNFHGASWWAAILILLALIPAFTSSLSEAIYQLPLKLKQDIRPLQKNVLLENVARFLLVSSLFIFPWTFIAILAAGIPRIFANLRLKKISEHYANWGSRLSVSVRARILKMVKRLMPGSVYYVVSGQISVWLISFFGSTSNVAEIGALGRISVLFTLVTTLFGTLVYPRFARLPSSSHIIFKRFFQVMALVAVTCGILVLGIWIFSAQILWVLGEGYLDLNYELVLNMIAGSLGVLSGAAFIMTTHRGWAIHPGVLIPINITAIIIGVLIMDVSTLIGVLYFNIFLSGIQMILNTGFFMFSYFRKLNTNYDKN